VLFGYALVKAGHKHVGEIDLKYLSLMFLYLGLKYLIIFSVGGSGFAISIFVCCQLETNVFENAKYQQLLLFKREKRVLNLIPCFAFVDLYFSLFAEVCYGASACKIHTFSNTMREREQPPTQLHLFSSGINRVQSDDVIHNCQTPSK